MKKKKILKIKNYHPNFLNKYRVKINLIKLVFNYNTNRKLMLLLYHSNSKFSKKKKVRIH